MLPFLELVAAPIMAADQSAAAALLVAAQFGAPFPSGHVGGGPLLR